MKFLLFSIEDIKKFKVHDYFVKLPIEYKIREIIIPRSIINKLKTNEGNFFQRLAKRNVYKKLKNIVIDNLEKYNLKWYYLFSNDICKEDRNILKIKFQEILGYGLDVNYELDDNLVKYIEEYIKDRNVKISDLKTLIVANKNTDLNLNLIKNLIGDYKCVNIFLKEKPTNYIEKQIKNINKDYGSTIEIIKQDKKALKEYNVIYFEKCNKKDFPRFRLDKSSLILDNEDEKNDKFNSMLVFLKEQTIDNTSMELIDKLTKKYGRLEVATTIYKLVNSTLDKKK